MAEWLACWIRQWVAYRCLWDSGFSAFRLVSDFWSSSFIVGIYPAASARKIIIIYIYITRASIKKHGMSGPDSSNGWSIRISICIYILCQMVTGAIINYWNMDSTAPYISVRICIYIYIICQDDDLIKEIKCMKQNKAPGIDNIGPKLLKLYPVAFCYPLRHIFNKSIEDCKYPEGMKMAKVVAIFKKGTSYFADNYRPISLLSSFNKIFEKILHENMTFFNKHNILFLYQYGFRKLYSTTFALIEITDKIKKLLDEENYVIGIYLDLTKAYDTVNHEILLYKLYKYGIRGHANHFFRAYLTERKQYSCTYSVKYIGLHIDEKLKWDIHIDSLIKSLVKYFGIFNHIKDYVSTHLARQMYYAFVYCRINYGVEVYSSWSNKLMDKVQVVQNKLLKLLLSRHPRSNTNELHNDLGILKMYHISEISAIIFAVKCLKEIVHHA